MSRAKAPVIYDTRQDASSTNEVSGMSEGFAKDLTVIVPGRNEQFMRHTIEDVLAHMKADTEIVAVCDSYWPDPPIVDHPMVKIIHTTTAIGQRAATNLGAQVSHAKYIMKLDAHCAVDEGFDVKMLDKMEPDMTMIPAMHRLHVFDWMCECGEREYQGGKPDKCKACGGSDFTMAMVWQPRVQYEPTVVWRFDSSLHFQYWRSYTRKPNKDMKNPHWDRFNEQAQTGIVETMSCIGACFLMERERFWELGGMDEGHGSWGQYGVELACKAWLSGGRMVTNTGTWFAHMFRTGNFARHGSPWPYPISQRQIDVARAYSRDVWTNNKDPKQTRPLSWLLEHFWPIDGWTEGDLEKQKARESQAHAA